MQFAGSPRPFSATRTPPALRIPAPLGWIGGALMLGAALAGLGGRRRSPEQRALRSIHWVSGAAYAVTAALDLAEHFRLEKEVTGKWLGWTVVPPAETAVHAAILATNLSAIVLSSGPSGPSRAVRRWLAVAPGVFLALGWIDELVFHRRRTPHREDIIHTTQHLAEGILWTALYAAPRPGNERRARI